MFDIFERGLDIALLIMMAYFFLRGIFRGVVKEIVAVLGVFVAFWVASIYWPIGEEHLKVIFDSAGHRGVVSFILIFVVVYFLIGVISIFVDKIVKITISPIVSALLGGVVGIVKGVLVCAVFLVVAGVFIKPTEKFFTSSELWPHIEPISKKAKEFMPEALRIAMEAKRTLPSVSDRYRPAQSENNSVGTSLTPAEAPQVDWPAIKNLLATRPGEINQAWRDKLRNLPSGQSLSEEEIKRFIADHAALFNKAPASPTGAPASPTGVSDVESTEAAPPTWPQPASE